MENRIRRTGLNNVSETWDENERKISTGRGEENSELEETIREEAAEYDHSDIVKRKLGGDRASVNDDDDNAA